MTGTLRRAPRAPQHICAEPPAIITWGEGPPEEFDGYRPMVILDRIPDGSTWTCDECGRIRVVWTRPDTVSRSHVTCGGPEWRDETLGERFRRFCKALLQWLSR
jgi:hypothetical protein